MTKRHVIISGTGRAGTTFLVQLLTELGLDTGFTDSSSGVFQNCNAGMECDIRDANSPYIVKDPRLCYDLDALLRDRRVSVDHAIVPVRDIYSAAESRRAVTERAGGVLRTEEGEVPGGLWLTDRPAEQEAILARNLYQLIHTVAEYDIPLTILHFPRLATEPDYLLGKLRSPFPGLDPKRFSEAFHRVARPELIHEFGGEKA